MQKRVIQLPRPRRRDDCNENASNNEKRDADAGDAKALAVQEEAVGRLGLRIEPFGPRTVIVREAPGALSARGVQDVVTELAAGLVAGGSPDALTDTVDRALSTMACRAAVKAGDRLDEGAIHDLLGSRSLVEHVETCPHGRPTTIHLSLAELEKRLHRR